MKNYMNILYQFDDPFVPVAGVSMFSLFENNRHIPDLRIYIMDGGISEENKNTIRELGDRYQRSIRFIDGKCIDEELNKRGIKKWRNSYSTYYKVYAINHIEEDIDRLLSLDGDTIIHGSVDSLYYSDLDGKTLGMVQDFVPSRYLEKIGIGKDKSYYNAGVILFDVYRWKRERCQDRIEQFFTGETQFLLYGEQDALNLLFSSDIQKLPIRYNYYAVFSAIGEILSLDLETIFQLYDLYDLYHFYSREEVKKAEQDALIYHFEGGTVAGRPWERETGCRVFTLWEQYQAISPWKDMKKQEQHEKRFHKIEKQINQIIPHPFFIAIYKLAFILYWKRCLSRIPEKPED